MKLLKGRNNQMQNGVAIIERTEAGTKGFYIDQDTIECARLNARTRKHQEAAQAALLESANRYKKMARAEKRRKNYNRKTFSYILLHGCTVGASVWAVAAGMLHPVIGVPVMLFSLCAACVRLGAWFGRGRK